MKSLPPLATPGTAPDLRPIFVALMVRWSAWKLTQPRARQKGAPSFQELADDIIADTGYPMTRMRLYRMQYRVSETEWHRSSRQPPMWVLMWLCERLGLRLVIEPAGVFLAERQRSVEDQRPAPS